MEEKIVKKVTAIALTVAKARNELRTLTDKLINENSIPQEAKKFGKLRWAYYGLDEAVSYLKQALGVEG